MQREKNKKISPQKTMGRLKRHVQGERTLERILPIFSGHLSSAGFTLAETLMTILVMTMVTAAITGGVVAARNAYRRISRRADAQTLLATTISALTEDFSGATKFEETGTDPESPAETGTTNFYTTSRTYSIHYVNEGPGDNSSGGTSSASSRKGIYVVPSDNQAAAVPLVTARTQTLDLYTQITAEEPGSTAAQAETGGTFTHNDETVTFWVAVYSTMSGISNPVEKSFVCIRTDE